jgi:hypothetical protein
MKKIILIMSLCLVALSACPRIPEDLLADFYSVEFGRTLWGSDYCVRNDAPQGGILVSVWAKIPDPGATYPWSRGNMDDVILHGVNWHLICLTGNSSATSPTDARYNANTMLGAEGGGADQWVNDYSYYESGGWQPEASYRGWVWAAWQMIVNHDSFTIRQWLKFGPEAAVIAAGEDRPTFAEIRDVLVADRGWTRQQADAWMPGEATGFQVGDTNGFLCHARVEARSTPPTLTELDDIARGQNVPPAWAEYELGWSHNRPDLSDRSGHNRDLVLQTGGTLHQGDPFP